jgi:hypothetical protein
MYRSQRLSGKENDVFRRHLLRRTRDALAKDAPSALLAYVRYFLLTDYALAEFRGQMTSLAAKDPDLLGALKRAVALLAQTPEDPLSQTARAHFHLFYPLALGAERAQGERILETLLHEDPTWEEAYLHLVASATASADALGRERWLEAYRKNAPSSHGPTLLERITHRDTDRRLG